MATKKKRERKEEDPEKYVLEPHNEIYEAIENVVG